MMRLISDPRMTHRHENDTFRLFQITLDCQRSENIEKAGTPHKYSVSGYSTY